LIDLKKHADLKTDLAMLVEDERVLAEKKARIQKELDDALSGKTFMGDKPWTVHEDLVEVEVEGQDSVYLATDDFKDMLSVLKIVNPTMLADIVAPFDVPPDPKDSGEEPYKYVFAPGEHEFYDWLKAMRKKSTGIPGRQYLRMGHGNTHKGARTLGAPLELTEDGEPINRKKLWLELSSRLSTTTKDVVILEWLYRPTRKKTRRLGKHALRDS